MTKITNYLLIAALSLGIAGCQNYNQARRTEIRNTQKARGDIPILFGVGIERLTDEEMAKIHQ